MRDDSFFLKKMYDLGHWDSVVMALCFRGSNLTRIRISMCDRGNCCQLAGTGSEDIQSLLIAINKSLERI